MTLRSTVKQEMPFKLISGSVSLLHEKWLGAMQGHHAEHILQPDGMRSLDSSAPGRCEIQINRGAVAPYSQRGSAVLHGHAVDADGPQGADDDLRVWGLLFFGASCRGHIRCSEVGDMAVCLREMTSVGWTDTHSSVPPGTTWAIVRKTHDIAHRSSSCHGLFAFRELF